MVDQIKLRPHQIDILNYTAGKMGIVAVPGSGKTFTLSYLAANLISKGKIHGDQEILVVTLVNSAVDNFYQRVGSFIKKSDLLPNWGYRVRTLHGLAHDIIRERPDLAGLDNKFSIIDEREALSIVDDAVTIWMRQNPNYFDDYFSSELDENYLQRIKREQFPALLVGLASNFIRYAKDYRLDQQYLQSQLERLPIPLHLAQFGTTIYNIYQRGLAYRGAVDFDDLIRYSLQILEDDPRLLERLQNRWPYILEDEAQDSSRLQEEILGILAGPHGNWVRAGDPNQAIFETFTTANPEFLRNFFARQDVQKKSLPTSSRSTKSIIKLANYLVEWTATQHPMQIVRNALQPPFVEPVSSEDNSPNPPDNPSGIHFVERKISPQEEIDLIVRSLSNWLPQNQEKTVAVLAPRNQRAYELVDALRKHNIPCIDNMLASSISTRASAGALTHILRYLADPQNAKKLATVYKVWLRSEKADPDRMKQVDETAERIHKLLNIEEFLYPRVLSANSDSFSSAGFEESESLEKFRKLVIRWHEAIALPIDQLVLTISRDIFQKPVELALAHKLANLLRQSRLLNPGWHLPQLTEELAIIARNERKFIGFSEDDNGFNPERYRGKVVVATMHKAKGLEWDRVYLMSLNNYDFPSGANYDDYIAEKWFLRDRINLGAEAIAQLNTLASPPDETWYQEGNASFGAREDYIRERLRLLFVAITRAKEELILLWNTGRRGESLPSVPYIKLMEYWRSNILIEGIENE